MSKLSKIILLAGIFSGIMLYSYADRGYSSRNRSKASLNIVTKNSFKSSLSHNLTSGLKFKGSHMSNANAGNPMVSNNLITYQKGNCVYIIPVSQKIFFPADMNINPGVKILIKSQG